jgi:ribose transport system permease protein
MTPVPAITDDRQGMAHRVLGSEYFVLGLCAAVVAAFGFLTPGFLSTSNLGNVLYSCLPLLLLATGQTLVLITGGIDLSITATVGFGSVLGALVMGGDQLALSNTPMGRQLHALGASAENARKAGLRATRLLASVYVFSGACAGLGGFLALCQLGSVSPKFGEFYEFDAITAAVLGGTSLFGGRGKVFPGTVLGVVLVKSIFSGLVIVRADPYLYPLITSAIIFVAVLLDSLRSAAGSRRDARLICRSHPDG